jgi:hypothetical protein
MPSDSTGPKINYLVRLMVFNWAFGNVIGYAVAGLVLISNVGGIRGLMFRPEVVLQGLALLFGGFGLFFGGVVAATAVMLLPTSAAEGGGGGGKRAPVLLPFYAWSRLRGARAVN